MYWITDSVSFCASSCQLGIDVPRTPRVMVRSRSPSSGSEPEGVSLNLNTPSVKLRGRSCCMNAAAGPLPSPFTPWQPMQRRSYTSLPYATHSSERGTVTCDASINCGSKRSRHLPRFVPSFCR